MLNDGSPTSLSQALARAEKEESKSPPPVQLKTHEATLTSQLNHNEMINWQVRDKTRRRLMDLMLEMEQRTVEIQATYQRNLLSATEQRDRELRQASEFVRREFEELKALEARFK